MQVELDQPALLLDRKINAELKCDTDMQCSLAQIQHKQVPTVKRDTCVHIESINQYKSVLLEVRQLSLVKASLGSSYSPRHD